MGRVDEVFESETMIECGIGGELGKEREMELARRNELSKG